MQHEIIVATTSNNFVVEELKRQSFFRSDVFLIGTAGVNGVYTICLISDGSKIGWPLHIAGDNLRKEFIDWMMLYEHLDLNYAHISLGGEVDDF